MKYDELIQEYPAVKSVMDEQDHLLFIRRRHADADTLKAQMRACEILDETLPGMVPSDRAAIMVAAVIELSDVNRIAFDTDKYSPVATALIAERNDESNAKMRDEEFTGPPSRELSRAVIAATTARLEYLGALALSRGTGHLGVAPSEVEGQIKKLMDDNDRHLRQTDAPRLSTAYRTTLRKLVDAVRGEKPSSRPTQDLSPN